MDADKIIERFHNKRIEIDRACRRAIIIYGDAAQLSLAQEECAELVTSISHFRRKREGSHLEMLEEMADVIIMWFQLCALVPFDDERLMEKIEEKLKRLEARMDNGVGLF